jgi:glycosyltransferase involved in cell wall biosynthesis
VVGEVENIQTELSKSLIYVCPLRFGAGFKNKILEASSALLPIVCTEISVNGINLKNSEHLLISKNDQDFANNIVNLFYDKDLRYRLSKNSLNQLKKIYSWSNVINEYNKVLF